MAITRPLRALTTLDRFGTVEWIRDEPMLRRLRVPELKHAMGFPSPFRMDPGTRGDRIKLLGNGVCPPVITRVLSSLASVHETDRSMSMAAE